MEQIKSDMSDMVNEFPDYYSSYFNDKEDDIQLMQVVTQPFWQSMRLSKKRLDSKEITMDLDITEDTSKSIFDYSIFDVNADGNHVVGTSVRNLQVKRIFRKGEKKLYSKKESEVGVTSMMQSNIGAGKVACPNCGFIGAVESFIDGCDACGSKFEVRDFGTKVSGFALEENAGKNFSKTSKRTFLGLGILVGLLVVGAILGLVIGVMSMQNETEHPFAWISVMAFPVALEVVPICFGFIVSLPIVYFILRLKWIRNYENRYENEEIVKRIVPAFSAEDFCQNLEYKLRNIHMASRVEEVKTFAECSLDKVVEGYQNVVESNVSHVKFVNAVKTIGGHVIDAEVLMKLAIYNGRGIRVQHEKLLLKVSGNDEVVLKKSAALREYKCDNCNSSIDILEGSTCRYCGAEFDYSRYGWVIKNYQLQKKPRNMYRQISIKLVLGYVLALALCVFIKGQSEDSIMFLLKEINESYKVAGRVSDEVQVICENAVISIDGKETADNHLEKYFEMELEYPTSDVDALMEACFKQMENEGYMLMEEKEDSYAFCCKGQGDDVDISIVITKYKDRIKVSFDPMMDINYHYES